MNNNIFVSATDKNCEHFAVPMFASFKRFNPGVRMFCIVKDISPSVFAELTDMGVELIPYAEPDSFPIRNFSIIISPYLEHIDYDKVMWMDIDALVLENIRNLFDFMEELVVLPRHLGNGWRYVQDNDMTSITLGTWIATKNVVSLMRDLYLNFNPKKITDEGEFIKTQSDKFCVRVLDGEKYSCCREMTDSLKQDEKGLYFVKWGKRQYPDFVHFSLKANNLRPTNFEMIRETVNA